MSTPSSDHPSASAAPARSADHPNFTFVELFAGIGGFRLALERLNGTCLLACEIEGQARATYLLNFPSPALLRDVREIPTFPPHDFLVAGFPCQPFSTANSGRSGFSDPKG